MFSEKNLNHFFKSYYSFYYLMCVPLHMLMFYLIWQKTPKILNSMRYFLYPSNLINIGLSFTAFVTGARIVNNEVSMALLCEGWCKWFGPEFCFHPYVFLLALTIASGLMNMHTLYYRTIFLQYQDSSETTWRLSLYSFHYALPILSLTLSYVPDEDFDAVYNETLHLHPEYDYTPYKKFGGFSNSHHPFMMANTWMMSILTIYVPAIGWYWRKKALKILDDNIQALSETTITLFRALLHGLALQIMIPIVCYIPIAISYGFNKYSGTQILLSQYLLCFLLTLPALIDPILTIYFIGPYRKHVLMVLSCFPSLCSYEDESISNSVLPQSNENGTSKAAPNPKESTMVPQNRQLTGNAIAPQV